MFSAAESVAVPLRLQVVGHDLAVPHIHGQTELRAIQTLQLVLFIGRQDQRMLGRFQTEADDIVQLGGELRIAADREAFDAMRFEPACMPDTPHAGLRDTGCASHCSRGPLGSIGRSRSRDPATPSATVSAVIMGVRSERGASLGRSWMPSKRKRPSHEATMRALSPSSKPIC